MRVLQLTTNADATYVTNQVEALAALGVESDVLEVPRTAENGRRAFDYLRFCPAVRKRCTTDYDLVHANFGLTIPAALAQRQVPVVTSLVGSDLMGRLGPVTNQLARFCDAVIVVSEEMRSLLSRDATVIPYGIDVDRFRPLNRRDARNVVGWPTDGHQVLFPYHPDRTVKNYPLAERVVERTERQLDEPVALRVTTGLDYRLMPLYMNAADALLLTSHREGSPSTVKEALACNTPVVSTPVGDVPERVAAVEACGVGDSAEELAGNLSDALEASEAPDGRTAVEDVRLDRMGERILEVYRRALEGAG